MVGEKGMARMELTLPGFAITGNAASAWMKCTQSSTSKRATKKALFATLTGTGMRCTEAFELHLKDLDLATGRIFVRGSIWNREGVSTKTNSGIVCDAGSFLSPNSPNFALTPISRFVAVGAGAS